MKRRQRDFQKVKLKVGKSLPKGRNETRTSFQSKKIHLLPQQIREATDKQTLKDLLSFMKSSDVKLKIANLQKLFVYVSQNKDQLFMFFHDILKELGRALQESDPKIRSETISVLALCAEIMTDIQFKTFVDPLSTYLNCMITHINFGVQQDSLKFLDVLLNSHCSIICQSHEILFHLLNLISYKESSVKKGSKNKVGRKLIDKVNSKISAHDWRMLVLKRMLIFLNGILSEKNSMPMETDDPKVYWDAKEPLYLPLYLESGAQPANFDYSQYCSMNSEECDNIKKFIDEFMYVLSAVLKSFSTSKYLSGENIKALCNVTQILCCITEWTIQNLDDAWNPLQRLMAFYNQLAKEFPFYPKAGKDENRDEVHCVQLNLGICHFYCLCSSLTENSEDIEAWDKIKKCLAHAMSNVGKKLNDESFSLALKISRNVMQHKNIIDNHKSGILIALFSILDANKLSPNANDLYSFFMDLSLNWDFNYLHTTLGMKNWFQSLIANLNFMILSRTFSPKYLDFIKQVCARKYPVFMETLNKLPSGDLIEFLKFDDEDVQRTIIQLIVSLDKLSPEFWQDLAETIRDKSFSLKTASRLIRLLHSRFSQSDVSPDDERNLLKFLLNVACDTSLIFDPSLDTRPLTLKEMLIDFQQTFGCHCIIYPTSDFERHQEMLKVCLECLLPFFSDEILRNCIIKFIGDVFMEHKHVKYPLHSMIAFHELIERCGKSQNKEDLSNFFQNFLHSCLLYNSLMLLDDIHIKHWTECCITSVQDCLEFVKPGVVFSLLESSLEILNDDQVIHVLRILVFFMQKQWLECVHKRDLCYVINALKPEESSQQQHSSLYHILHAYITHRISYNHANI